MEKKVCLKIDGMHCDSCEVLIEQKFREIPGVMKVKVDQARGRAELQCSTTPDLEVLQRAVKDDGYRVSFANDAVSEKPVRNSKKDYLQIGAVFLIFMGIYFLAKEFNFIPKGLTIPESISLSFAFVLGLVAATSSCLAVTGGLLLAVSAKYSSIQTAQVSETRIKKFQPYLLFNIGRIISYTVFGGLIGVLGSLISFSSRVNGIVIIFVSVIMIGMGFRLLNMFPWLRYFTPRMPKFFALRILGVRDRYQRSAPFLFGAATFFLPCGFTQALQLYVLGKGDALTGALIMLMFSLGTAPALMAVSAISSFSKGTAQKYFMKFAGVLVILLGLWNIKSGFLLTGTNFSFASSLIPKQDVAQAMNDPNVKLIGGKQVVEMKVSGLDYYPYRFTVQKDVPVEWRIDAREAVGCAQAITVSKLGLTALLSGGGKIITFTPRELGEIPFSCSMGMTTQGSAFVVVPRKECDPTLADCLS